MITSRFFCGDNKNETVPLWADIVLKVSSSISILREQIVHNYLMKGNKKLVSDRTRQHKDGYSGYQHVSQRSVSRLKKRAN